MPRFDTSDPLRRAKRPVRRPPGAPPLQASRPGGAHAMGNLGHAPPAHLGHLGHPAHAPAAHLGHAPAAPPAASAPSGPGPSSSAPAEEWKEFHLRACTAQELADSRYHIVKFQSRKNIDIDQQFTPPIRFQRKDPKNLQITVGEGGETEEKDWKSFFKKRKTHQVLGGTDEEGEAVRKLRQEEHLPWVMEDFDGKNAWVSSYEAAQSDSYVVFVFDHFGFKMIPIEKWYKMQSRNKFASLTLEQAEERMQKKDSGHNRWIMDKLQLEKGVSGTGSQHVRRMRTVEGGEERGANGEEMDYDEEFADDEEAPLVDGPEEELKEVQDRIKKEQLQATHPSVAKDELDEDLFGDDQEIDKQGKKLKRYLRSLEKNAYYDSDDDENPYASGSDNNSETEIKQEPDYNNQRANNDHEPSLVVFRRKNIKNLPHGFAVIQLPQNLLRKFPQGEWNPKIPRREGPLAVQTSTAAPAASSQQQQQQQPLSAASPIEPKKPTSPLAPPPQSQYSATNTPDETLLTTEDVREAFQGRSLSTLDLVSALKKRLKQNKDNKDRLRIILKEVAQVKDGKLVLA